MSLSAEEQLKWAISHGHEMLSLLHRDAKLTVEKSRNGAKMKKASGRPIDLADVALIHEIKKLQRGKRKVS